MKKANTWIENGQRQKLAIHKEKYKCLTTLVIKEIKCIIKYLIFTYQTDKYLI